MQASGSCLNDQNNIVDGYCGWDPRINGQFSSSNGFTLPMNKETSFIEDLNKLVNIDPTSFCGFDLYLGILMRYVKISSAYLGKDEDGIDFDITYYRPRKALDPQLNEDVINEIEQIAIFKYAGVPHWGKNRNVAFESVICKYKNGEKFYRVKERYDPLGLFSSEWTDQVLELKEGLIIIKQVVHLKDCVDVTRTMIVRRGTLVGAVEFMPKLKFARREATLLVMIA
uniref:D-arabinono-1,4-lactone oxidase C-terminal domain-containing protein n=1 Tax=Chenopodium quinoa TaxID=63459 RepID=A0A803KUB4_CHEQI